MKIATAAYPLDPLTTWEAYAEKTAAWVAEAAGNGADLLVFPEYGRMELAMLAGAAVAGDLQASLKAISDRVPDADALLQELSDRHGVHILGPSAPVYDGPGLPVNRASFVTPHTPLRHQDKQVMTRFEREIWGVRPGGPLDLIETDLGPIGVLICYDAEFPLLGRALVEQGAEMLLAPSCTDAPAGYWRVRIGAMARALEGQCVVAHAPTVGEAVWSPAVDDNHGAAAIYGPPDIGFPPNGVLADGGLDVPGWVYAEVDRADIAHVRRAGKVLNHAHWSESHSRVSDFKQSPRTP